jgi:ketosteroid isomerase-like protein
VSERNVELHRRAVQAYNAPDIGAFIAYCDPQIEFRGAMAAVGGGVYRGHDGLRRWRLEREDVWDEIRIEPEAFFDLGDHTLVFHVAHARGRQSGAEVAMANAQVARWREGLIVYLRTYLRREDALEELGVSEAALEPITP